MDMNRDSNPNTRQRLLESACGLFAEKGFTKATNKEICDRAGANIAAVNYYFGSKQNLYAEAWRKAFQDSLKAHPPDGGVPEDAPPEERLRGRVKAMIHFVADTDNQAFRIVHKEMAEPTPLLKQVHRECMRPLQQAMTAVVRELLGRDAPQKHVHFCQASIGAQCFGVIMHLRMASESGRAPHPPGPPIQDIAKDLEGYAEHVAEFSLAGIRAIRQQAERGSTDD